MLKSRKRINKQPIPTTGSEPVASIYERIQRSLRRYASSFFSNHHEIEDVVQEAFLRVIEAKSVREVEVSDSYVYRTVHNLALNMIDKSERKLSQRLGDLSSEPVTLTTASIEDQYESTQRFEHLCEAVRQLPLQCQRVFILRRVYGMSHKEIAEQMSISVKTVETHLTKAIVRCTDFMERIDNQDNHASTRTTDPASRRAN